MCCYLITLFCSLAIIASIMVNGSVCLACWKAQFQALARLAFQVKGFLVECREERALAIQSGSVVNQCSHCVDESCFPSFCACRYIQEFRRRVVVTSQLSLPIFLCSDQNGATTGHPLAGLLCHGVSELSESGSKYFFCSSQIRWCSCSVSPWQKSTLGTILLMTVHAGIYISPITNWCISGVMQMWNILGYCRPKWH